MASPAVTALAELGRVATETGEPGDELQIEEGVDTEHKDVSLEDVSAAVVAEDAVSTTVRLLDEKVTVHARAFYSVPVTAEAGATLRWDLQALGADTLFSVLFVPDSHDAAPVTPLTLVEPSLQQTCAGVYNVTQHGNLVVRCDNRGSMLRSRRVWLVVDADLPSHTHRVKAGFGVAVHRPRRSISLTSLGLHRIAGSFAATPEEGRWSAGLRQLVDTAFAGLDPAKLVDYHTHVVGCGAGGTGCVIAPFLMDPVRHPVNYVKLKAFMSACGIPSLEVDADYIMISRLVMLIQRSGVRVNAQGELVHGPHGRNCLLAFDMAYDEDGHVLPAKSTIHIPNDYVYLLSKKFPKCFIPTCSVNPYRNDAVAELRRCAARGIRIIKWLPNSMHFDPSHPKCDVFYDAVRELDMVILSHTGEEHAVAPPPPNQEFGNPLRLRRGLDKGVKFIAAHCATEGFAQDLDSPTRARTAMFDLWLRLMENPTYEGLLFADISAVISFRRVPYLRRLIARTDLHNRLLYGSDYPVPCLNIVVHTRKLVRAGLITAAQRTLVNELFHHNPLLFDIVLKRTLRGPGGERFADSIFQEHPGLPPMRVVGTDAGDSVAVSAGDTTLPAMGSDSDRK